MNGSKPETVRTLRSKTADIEITIGQRIRERRRAAGLTQEEMGEEIGVTYQQVQKYETAANRISASRLFLMAKALDVPLTSFFEE